MLVIFILLSLFPQCDQCEGAWVPVVSFLVFNVCVNVLVMLIVKVTTIHLMGGVLAYKHDYFLKRMLLYRPVYFLFCLQHGSASLLYIILTLSLPVVNVAFSMRFIENPPEPLDMYTQNWG